MPEDPEDDDDSEEEEEEEDGEDSEEEEEDDSDEEDSEEEEDSEAPWSESARAYEAAVGDDEEDELEDDEEGDDEDGEEEEGEAQVLVPLGAIKRVYRSHPDSVEAEAADVLAHIVAGEVTTVDAQTVEQFLKDL